MSGRPSRPAGNRTAAVALARRGFHDARVRMFAFGYLFAAVGYIQPIGYRHAYPSLADRLAFAHSFANNLAIRLFYGEPHDLLTVGGYSAWRVGGTLAIFAAAWGLLAAVRALRTEEDAGRTEILLAGPVGRGTAFLASMAAIAAGTLVLWLMLFAGLVIAGLSAGGSAYLALAVASVIPVFVGVGALTSQLASSRRVALELGGAVVGLSLLLRVIADTSGGVGRLRWLTPLGWAEELRPFTGAHPLVLLIPVSASVLLLTVAWRLEAGRDIGSGLLPAHDKAPPRLWLLSSPTAQALRAGLSTLLVWLCSIAGFGLVIGMISKSISAAGISRSLQREIAKLGSGSIFTPSGYLGFAFIFFILAVSLFACAQVGAARHEEADERLDVVLALPVGRRAWLAGRLALASAGAAAISLTAGASAWAGAALQGVSISLPRMLGAGANCLPIAVLFLGVAALTYALAPRASAGIAYGLVTVAFLWQLFGSLLGAPHWLVELTPFAHVGLVPAQPFRLGSAAVMIALGVLAQLAAIALFERRDLRGS